MFICLWGDCCKSNWNSIFSWVYKGFLNKFDYARVSFLLIAFGVIHKLIRESKWRRKEIKASDLKGEEDWRFASRKVSGKHPKVESVPQWLQIIYVTDRDDWAANKGENEQNLDAVKRRIKESEKGLHSPLDTIRRFRLSDIFKLKRARVDQNKKGRWSDCILPIEQNQSFIKQWLSASPVELKKQHKRSNETTFLLSWTEKTDGIVSERQKMRFIQWIIKETPNCKVEEWMRVHLRLCKLPFSKAALLFLLSSRSTKGQMRLFCSRLRRFIQCCVRVSQLSVVSQHYKNISVVAIKPNYCWSAFCRRFLELHDLFELSCNYSKT